MPGRTRTMLTALAATASLVVVAGCSGSSQPARLSQSARSAEPATTSASTAVQAAPAPSTSSAAAPTSAAEPEPEPKPKPKPVNHCARNTAAQKVLVSLAKQHMWLCAKQRTVYDNAITSGMSGQYTETPRGTYVIEGRNRNTVLTLNTGQTYPVRYWIPFDAPLFGFHDSSWQTFPYGSPKYRTDGSHGCIHMPLKAIAFLYRWSANTTTDVRIA